MDSRTDLESVLARTARRNGWERQHNQLDYYQLRLTRPEPEGRTSMVLIRLTNHLVEAQVEVGGLRQNLIRPSRARIEELLTALPPRPQVVHTDRPAGLRERLVLAMVETLTKGDPRLIIGVDDQRLAVDWRGPCSSSD